MKRSEMIVKMIEFDQKFNHTRSLYHYFSDMLEMQQKAGMTPPEITRCLTRGEGDALNEKIGDLEDLHVITVKEWDSEDA